jgi:hypothetical protein
MDFQVRFLNPPGLKAKMERMCHLQSSKLGFFILEPLEADLDISQAKLQFVFLS